MAIVVIALLVVATVTAFIVWRVQESRKPVVTKLPTQQEYVSGSINSLEASAPAASASEQEQLQYYDKLQSFYDLNGDYEKAAEVFEKRASLKSSDLDYEDYSRAARFYREIGNKEKGAAAVDKAISLLPATANEATGYDHAKEREALLALKQEIQK
jgi:tetratricopeptide (TPR) repeat protein